MVQIITDTTACLPGEMASGLQIPVIPQIINFGEETYYEGVDIDNEEFMRRLRGSSSLPKTAAPPPELFVEEFRKLVPRGEPILCIHPSSEVSGTVRSAEVAALEFPGADIRVIDTRSIATALGSMVQRAAEWAREGWSADEIEVGIKDLSDRARIYFLVATLEYLARGGRIGGASKLLGSVLQIKPILTFRDGRVEVFERERTKRRALARLEALVVENAPQGEEAMLSVMHAGVPEEGRDLARCLGEAIGVDGVWVADVPPAIVTHGGPGVLGVGFFTNR